MRVVLVTVKAWLFAFGVREENENMERMSKSVTSLLLLTIVGRFS